MDTVTYQNDSVHTILTENFVPVKLEAKEHPDTARKHKIAWTPTAVLLNNDGEEHYRIEGFTPPDEFAPLVYYGLAKTNIGLKNFDKARNLLKTIIEKQPRSSIAPESLYWLGIAEYRATLDNKNLIPVWEQLLTKYPDSIWAKKASFIKS